MDANWLANRMMFLIPVLLSLSVHEWAHAWMATKLGDDTARLQGRLTINPLAHIDPVGTFLLPLLGVPFGWAVPVPFNPNRFSRRVSMSTGTMLTAIAGPISNILIAAVVLVLYAFLYAKHSAFLHEYHAVEILLQQLLALNVVLATFNMIPIPPLDGSHIANALLPAAVRPVWDFICSNGVLLLIVILVVPQIIGISVFSGPQRAAWWVLNRLIEFLR